MTPTVSVAVAAMCLLVASTELRAQTCVGQPSLRDVRLNGGANVHMVSQGRGYEGRLAAGNHRAFASATAGTIQYDHGSRTRSYVGGVNGGFVVNPGSAGLSLCAVSAVSYENGPDNIVLDQSELGWMLGASLGATAAISERVQFVSSLGAGFQHIRSRTQSTLSAVATSYNTSGLNLAGSAGLQFHQQFLARVSLHVPAGLLNGEDRSAFFVVGLMYSPAGRR